VPSATAASSVGPATTAATSPKRGTASIACPLTAVVMKCTMVMVMVMVPAVIVIAAAVKPDVPPDAAIPLRPIVVYHRLASGQADEHDRGRQRDRSQYARVHLFHAISPKGLSSDASEIFGTAKLALVTKCRLPASFFRGGRVPVSIKQYMTENEPIVVAS
jgi:hypothetical protein